MKFTQILTGWEESAYNEVDISTFKQSIHSKTRGFNWCNCDDCEEREFFENFDEDEVFPVYPWDVARRRPFSEEQESVTEAAARAAELAADEPPFVKAIEWKDHYEILWLKEEIYEQMDDLFSTIRYCQPRLAEKGSPEELSGLRRIGRCFNGFQTLGWPVKLPLALRTATLDEKLVWARRKLNELMNYCERKVHNVMMYGRKLGLSDELLLLQALSLHIDRIMDGVYNETLEAL